MSRALGEGAGQDKAQGVLGVGEMVAPVIFGQRCRNNGSLIGFHILLLLT